MADASRAVGEEAAREALLDEGADMADNPEEIGTLATGAPAGGGGAQPLIGTGAAPGGLTGFGPGIGTVNTTARHPNIGEDIAQANAAGGIGEGLSSGDVPSGVTPNPREAE